jgi:anti-sigma regulatory factor (Ser/Thr protein kinase)
MAEKRSDEIRTAIMKQIFEDHMVNVNKLSERFSVSPQSIYKQIYFLEDKTLIQGKKSGRSKTYRLVTMNYFQKVYDNHELNEDEVFRRDFAGIIEGASDIARQAFVYVFTEMLNNVIEHSESEKVLISADINAYAISCTIIDFGVGIFNKIQKSLGLAEKRYAILELAKGKFTTEPESHTGEGIFFSSKAADRFYIFSDELTFIGNNTNNIDRPLISYDQKSHPTHGTIVMFDIALNKETTLAELFDKHPCICSSLLS